MDLPFNHFPRSPFLSFKGFAMDVDMEQAAENLFDLNVPLIDNDDEDLQDEEVVVENEEVGAEKVVEDGIDDERIVLDPPTVGMEFDSHEKANEHFKSYAKQCGFSVCKRPSHTKLEGENKRLYQISFACNKYRPPSIRGVDEPSSQQEEDLLLVHYTGAVHTNMRTFS